MSSIIGSFVKYTLFTVAVLLASQIEVSDKRICDHVGDFAASTGIRKALKSISERFDFTEGTDVSYSKTAKHKKGSGPSRYQQEEPEQTQEHTTSDRTALSGVLKKSR